MPFLDDMAVWVTGGLDLTSGVDLFVGRMIDRPNRQVGLYATAGLDPSFTFGANSVPVLEQPGLQIRCRASDEATAESLCRDVWDRLTRCENETIGGTRYLVVTARQPPFPNGRDQRDRDMWAANFIAILQPAVL